ncbi:MAG: hypothetical protein L6R37_007785 [Teloschistes peruensis]|nr:MAG: hypothetical protein L6R37_007785 [Teloschistes peruensis]
MELDTLADLNLVSNFLAFQNYDSIQPVDCIVLCGSSILHCAETIFSTLRSAPALTSTLVICGGIGHSTPFLYAAIAKNSRYADLRNLIEGLPESSVLDIILERDYGKAAIEESGCRIVVETKSTNCGANAIETRKILESLNIPMPKSMLIVQDPTMSLRTHASFQKSYADVPNPPRFSTFPTFVPNLREEGGELVWDIPGVNPAGLWDVERFVDLVLGEVPRLRDNDEGYGPRGKGFVVHVDVPDEIEEAWRRLSNRFERRR